MSLLDHLDPRENRLLGSLPADKLDRLRLLPAAGAAGAQAARAAPRQSIPGLWFPVGAVLSLIAVVDGEPGVEVATINRLHTTEERCARWLLQPPDRVGADDVELTQEFLGQMLGVRRGTVSPVAGTVQQAGLITYIRGRTSVLDGRTSARGRLRVLPRRQRRVRRAGDRPGRRRNAVRRLSRPVSR